MVYQYWLLALRILVLDAAQGVVAIPGSHARKSNPSPPGLHVLPLIEDNSDDYHSWIAEVAAGTPPQKMKLTVDIAKSTTWFISDKTFAECDGCNDGYYQLNKSKTSSPILGHTAISYGDPTTYPPTFLNKSLVFSTPTRMNSPELVGLHLAPMWNMDMHRGRSTALSWTISLQRKRLRAAPTVLTYTSTVLSQASPSVLLSEPSIVLTGLRQTVLKGKSHASEVTTYEVHKNDSVFLLDSANQYLRFRHSFVDPLYKTLGAVNDGHDAYFVPCEKRNMPGSWDFQFGDVTIKIPYNKIITNQSDDRGKTCWVGVLTTWKGQLVLGQPFLEAAYLAFDLDNKQVALAPPANCGEKLVAFGSGPNAIPNLKGC
ncbi:hypothetical protein FOVSG1_015365 [Fusarium oxysporum f. sp. vasinfectum]